jgi:hypothetical protein
MHKIDLISNLNMSVRSLLISAPSIFYRNKFFDWDFVTDKCFIWNHDVTNNARDKST